MGLHDSGRGKCISIFYHLRGLRISSCPNRKPVTVIVCFDLFPTDVNMIGTSYQEPQHTKGQEFA